jgi:hypothetical protein
LLSVTDIGTPDKSSGRQSLGSSDTSISTGSPSLPPVTWSNGILVLTNAAIVARDNPSVMLPSY